MSTITVYTKPSCGPCLATKRALDRAGIHYTIVDLAEHPTALEYVVDLGYSTAPVVVISDDEHWAGFRPDLIDIFATAERNRS